MFNSANLSKSVVFLYTKVSAMEKKAESWKLCWKLCSFKWLKLSLNLVRYFMPIELWILKILFALGLMNSRRHFLNNINVSEFLIKESNLFHSNTGDEKKVFLKYSWFTLKIGRLFKFLVICLLLLFGTRWIWRWFSFNNFKKRLNFLYNVSY